MINMNLPTIVLVAMAGDYLARFLSLYLLSKIVMKLKMPRRGAVASLGKKVDKFNREIEEVQDFIKTIESCRKITDKHKHWCYQQGIIRIYRAFEVLILNCLVALLNKDASHLKEAAGIKLSKNFYLSQDTSRFVVTGGEYFNFRNYDGLIKECRRFLPDDHQLICALRGHKKTIEKMTALRNFSAHDSHKAKAQMKKVLRMDRPGEPGKWLRGGKNKPGEPIQDLIKEFEKLAGAISSIAK